MNFITLPFLIFISVVVPVFYLLPQKYKNFFLLAASYFFYAYWSCLYLALLVLLMSIDYVLALLIDKSPSEKNRSRLLTLSVVVNLGVLFFFKYYNYFSAVSS